MVFCYQNCIDLLCEKIVLVIKKNFWNSRLKAKSFQKFWDHLNNLFKQLKVRTISGNRTLVPVDFWDPKKKNNYNSNRKILLRFRNLQEKLENKFFLGSVFCTHTCEGKSHGRNSFFDFFFRWSWILLDWCFESYSWEQD